jgi:hypothetical protein
MHTAFWWGKLIFLILKGWKRNERLKVNRLCWHDVNGTGAGTRPVAVFGISNNRPPDSEEHTASIFRAEDGGRIGIYLQIHTALQVRRGKSAIKCTQCERDKIPVLVKPIALYRSVCQIENHSCSHLLRYSSISSYLEHSVFSDVCICNTQWWSKEVI